MFDLPINKLKCSNKGITQHAFASNMNKLDMIYDPT